MEKSLNDRVEGVFRGIVFIVLSFMESIGLLILCPFDGYVRLIIHLRKKSEDQVRPYAFLFFAFVLAFFAPSLIDALGSHVAGPFEYQIHDSATPESGALGRAYQQTAQKLESKAATAIFVAAVIGVVAFQLGAKLSGSALFGQHARRQTWLQAFFFVGGLQVALFTLVAVLDRLGEPSPTEMRLLTDFLRSPWTLLFGYGGFRPFPLYIHLLGTALLIAALLVPFGMAHRFGSRLSAKFGGLAWLRTVLLVAVIDAVMMGSFSLAAYTSDEVQPQDKPVYPFSIRYTRCELDVKAAQPNISGTAVVRADPKDPWDFDKQDFDLFIAADRTETESPVRPGRPGVLSPKRIGAGKLPVTFSAISPPIGEPPFLLQAGGAILIRFEAEATPRLIAFLSSHPDGQRCTLSYTQDYPIGAIGTLTTKE